MSKIVFVLGAGASAHCETPLTNNFLEVAQDLMRKGEIDEVKEDFEKVFDAVGNLHAAQQKAKINTYNIEDVYAAFEMGKLLGRLPGIDENAEIRKLTSSIKKVICYTLEKTTRIPTDARTNPFQAYYEFTEILRDLVKAGQSFSVLTFNYDVGLDYALYRNQLLLDYGLNDIELKSTSILCLKLHGSLNWGRCKKCKRIKPYRQFQYTEHKQGLDYDTIPIVSTLKTLRCECGESLEEDSFIVPPTWNKTAFHEQIELVWKRAALELTDAENIFVLGYSFPETDMFFRYLFALGVDMRTVLRGFYVYNPDPKVEERFKSLLGSGVEQRFRYEGLKFEDAIRKEINGWKDYMELGRRYLTIPQILDIR